MQNVLITNGGPHSAAKWAEATASHIVDIADHVSGERRGAAIKLQAAIIDILEGHHVCIQDGERAAIKEHKHDRLNHDVDPEHHVTVEHVVNDIIAAAKGTEWESDFANPDMAGHLTVLLNQHFSTSINIERSWHADRNPDAPESKAFHARHNLRPVAEEGGAS
jgi:hypothetical protein